MNSQSSTPAGGNPLASCHPELPISASVMQTSLRVWSAKVFPFFWCFRCGTDKFAE
jgi:hypothetical protein